MSGIWCIRWLTGHVEELVEGDVEDLAEETDQSELHPVVCLASPRLLWNRPFQQHPGVHKSSIGSGMNWQPTGSATLSDQSTVHKLHPGRRPWSLETETWRACSHASPLPPDASESDLPSR